MPLSDITKKVTSSVVLSSISAYKNQSQAILLIGKAISSLAILLKEFLLR